SMLSALPPGLAQQIPIPQLAQTFVRVASTLNEVAAAARVDGNAVKFVIGVRTMWSNPDDVVKKISAINPDDVLNGKGAAAVKPIADGASGSPFAADVSAGGSGMFVPMAIVGMLAAVAIPAFVDYTRKSKRTGAELMLNRIGKNLKVYYITQAKFPVGDTS